MKSIWMSRLVCTCDATETHSISSMKTKGNDVEYESDESHDFTYTPSLSPRVCVECHKLCFSLTAPTTLQVRDHVRYYSMLLCNRLTNITIHSVSVLIGGVSLLRPFNSRQLVRYTTPNHNLSYSENETHVNANDLCHDQIVNVWIPFHLTTRRRSTKCPKFQRSNSGAVGKCVRNHTFIRFISSFNI